MASESAAAQTSAEQGIAPAAENGVTWTVTDWQNCGTTEWRVDESGCLIIRPTDGVSGELNSQYLDSYRAWQRTNAIAVKVEGSVSVSGENVKWGLFDQMRFLTTTDLKNLDTSKVKNFNSWFSGCGNLSSLDIAGWDTSSAEDMGSMFYACMNLTSLDVSKWDTSKVKSMWNTFGRCNELNALNVSNWDTSNVENMRGLFCFCNKLEALNLAKWNTSNVEYMDNMFEACANLKSLDLTDWNTSKVTGMGAMFANASSIEALNLSNWNTSNVTQMDELFSNCSSLQTLDVSNWNTSNVKNMRGMFANCKNIESLDLSEFNTSNVEHMAYIFDGCSKLAKLNISQFDTTKTIIDNGTQYNKGSFFRGCDALSHVDVGAKTTITRHLPAERTIDSSDPLAGAYEIVEVRWADDATGSAYAVSDIPEGKAASYTAALYRNGQPIVNPTPDPTPDPTPTPDPQEQPTERIAGEESADTAAQIALKAFPEGSDWVVIARDDDFADAMSATGLAGALDAPIVLTSRYGLSGATADAVEKLGATKAFIVGGTGAIPGDLEGELAAVGCSVEKRVFGEEDYDTSVECARLIQEKGGSADYAVVAYGQNFQDALSMSSFAYRYKCPIFLQTYGDTSSQRRLPGAAEEMLTGKGAYAKAKVFVAGGYGAVSEASAEGALGAERVVRLAGEDGFDTSNQIARYMVGSGLLSASTVCVANGAPAPKGTDALAGAALAGRAGGVMLLANANPACGDVSEATIKGKDSKGDAAFLAEHASEVSDAYVLGGSYVMPEGFRAEIDGILK